MIAPNETALKAKVPLDSSSTAAYRAMVLKKSPRKLITSANQSRRKSGFSRSSSR